MTFLGALARRKNNYADRTNFRHSEASHDTFAQWSAVGDVPRARMRDVEKIEQLIESIPFKDGTPVVDGAPAQQLLGRLIMPLFAHRSHFDPRRGYGDTYSVEFDQNPMTITTHSRAVRLIDEKILNEFGVPNR